MNTSPSLGISTLWSVSRFAWRASSQIATIQRRTMATSGQRKEFLCILPDKPGTEEIRKKVKATHYEGIKPLIASRKINSGGAMLQRHPEEGEAPPIIGSAIVYTAESAEKVREILEQDIYATAGVWDLEKIKIYPYIPAVRQPLE